MPVALGGIDQRHRDAVLDRPARIERLDLRHDVRRDAGGHAGKAYERGMADRVEDGVLDVGLGRGEGHTHSVKEREGGSQGLEDPSLMYLVNRFSFATKR